MPLDWPKKSAREKGDLKQGNIIPLVYHPILQLFKQYFSLYISQYVNCSEVPKKLFGFWISQTTKLFIFCQGTPSQSCKENKKIVCAGKTLFNSNRSVCYFFLGGHLRCAFSTGNFCWLGLLPNLNIVVNIFPWIF
jgi:hypothetical protein